jgi:hypothetical protein
MVRRSAWRGSFGMGDARGLTCLLFSLLVLGRCRARKEVHVPQGPSLLRLVSYSPCPANDSRRARPSFKTTAPKSVRVRHSHRAAQLRRRDWTHAHPGSVEEDADTPLSKRAAKRIRLTAASTASLSA